MTIKQYGGVFGRNPTFNDVTIEGQLTFDGDIDISSDLKVDGDLDVTGKASFADGSLASPSVAGLNDGNTGVAWLAPGELSLIEDGNEIVKVSGNGIDVTGGVTLTTSLGLPDGTNSNPSLRNMGDSNTGIYFPASDNCAITTGGVQRLLANSSGVKLPDGNLIIGTSGKGIDFSATAGTGTSELLDDYEEGTWTPTIIGTTGSAPIATLVAATYTKVGDMVTVFGYWTTDFSSHTITGDVQIGGLPFAATTNNNQLVSITYSNWATFDQADISLSARITSSTVRLLRGSSTTAVVTGDLTTTVDATIMFGCTYKA